MAKYGLNQVTLIGNLGKDPELKYLDQGIALVNLRLACTESFRDKTGNYVDRTEWVSVNLWRSQAEIAAKYCKKGSTICVEGRLVSRSWETPQGEKRSRTEVEGRRIILLDSAPVTMGGGNNPFQQSTATGAPQAGNPAQSAPGAPTPSVANPASPEIQSPQAPSQEEDLDDLPF